VFQFIFFNVFVSLTLIYLRQSTAATEKKELMEKNREDQVIAIQIKKDTKKAEEAEKNKYDWKAQDRQTDN